MTGNAAWRSLSDKPGRSCALESLGIESAEEVKALAEQAKPLDAIEALRLSIHHMRKGGCGRRGLPRTIVRRMYLDYLRLGSVQKVGRLYNRSRQSIWEIFKSHFLPMNERNLNARIIWGGETWTYSKGGYRPTTGARGRMLHRAVWEKESGKPVPAGWQVSFKNGDFSDIRFSNLICLPIAQITLFHYHRRFPERAQWTLQQRREFWRIHYRDLARRKAIRFKQLGLRCDGKPMLRRA